MRLFSQYCPECGHLNTMHDYEPTESRRLNCYEITENHSCYGPQYRWCYCTRKPGFFERMSKRVQNHWINYEARYKIFERHAK